MHIKRAVVFEIFKISKNYIRLHKLLTLRILMYVASFFCLTGLEVGGGGVVLLFILLFIIYL